MKKSNIFRAAAAIVLAGTVALCATACGVNSGKLSDPPKDVKLSAYPIAALDGYTPSAVDRFGMITAEKTGGYALYCVSTGKIFSSASAFVKATDGLYYTENDENTVFYGQNGVVATLPKDVTFSKDELPVVTSESKMIYVKPDGTAVYEDYSIQPVFVEADENFPLKDYCLQEEHSNPLLHSVFDKKGKFLKTINLSRIFGVYAMEYNPFWCIKNKIYVQYSVLVSENDKNYDYYSYDFGKMKLVTKSYDVGTGKVKEYDNVPYLISANHFNAYYPPYADHYAFLLCAPIIDKQVTSSENAVLQCFNESMQLHTDVQALMAGTDQIFYDGDYICLRISTRSAGNRPLQLYRNGKLLSTGFDSFYLGNGVIHSKNGFYKANGDLLFTDKENEFYSTGRTISGDNLIYYITSEDNAAYMNVYSLDKDALLSKEEYVSGSIDNSFDVGLEHYYIVKKAGKCTLRNAYFNFAIFSDVSYIGEIKSDVFCRTETGFYQLISFGSPETQKNYLFRANGLPHIDSMTWGNS
ncbi:MAG: hypothetical protein DBX59_04585 [Bacillota bacterium]|nr:MAG: hypothetical protein DBX59_04585 [Bacillota bacterium]